MDVLECLVASPGSRDVMALLVGTRWTIASMTRRTPSSGRHPRKLADSSTSVTECYGQVIGKGQRERTIGRPVRTIGSFCAVLRNLLQTSQSSKGRGPVSWESC
jgi:hypothetical protein